MWFRQQLLRVMRPQTPRAAAVRALWRIAELSGACAPGRGNGVADAAVLLGHGIGMRSRRVAALGQAARLLDIGLIGLPLDVAQRSRPLTSDEEAAYQLHPMRNLELTRDIGMTYEQLNGIMHHHERYDGLGYPMGLARHEIPEFARILTIADEYDRMTGGRAGDPTLSAKDALRELHALAGAQFDPELVGVFSRVLSQRPPS